MPRISIIISFYNHLDFLQRVLAGFARQSLRDFEIIIADDGSPDAVVRELQEMIQASDLPIRHLWHPDQGFRKNKILNRAITAAAADYLVFIDGDCIPHREFVREHFENRQPRTCLAGRRVDLSPGLSAKLTPEAIRRGFLEKGFFRHLLWDSIRQRTKRGERGLYLRSPLLRRLINKKQRGLLGCNFSIHKDDMLAINGFDERYQAPGIGEDSDLQWRLQRQGVRLQSVNNIAVQYHLYHPLLARSDANLRIFEQVRASGTAVTPFGIRQNHPEGSSDAPA